MDTTVRRELDQLRAEVERLKRRQRRGRLAGTRVLGTIMVALLLLIPSAIGASDRFDDVPDGAFYHDDAGYLADNGVTQGCGGPNYCPDQVVNRGQMAAFLSRLGGFGDHPPVVNAKTAQTATTAATADSASTLGTYTSADFVRIKDHTFETYHSPIDGQEGDGPGATFTVGAGGVGFIRFPEVAATHQIYFPIEHTSYLFGEWIHATKVRVCMRNYGGANVKHFSLESSVGPMEIAAGGQAGTGPDLQCIEFNVLDTNAFDKPLVLHLRVDVADPNVPTVIVESIRVTWNYTQSPFN